MIERAISTAPFFLILINTDLAGNSRWVRDELGFALDEEERRGVEFNVVPLVMNRDLVPLRLQNRVYIDLAGNYFEGLLRLVARIRGSSTQAIDDVLAHGIPSDIMSVLYDLNHLGVEVWHLLEQEDFDVIRALGGEPSDDSDKIVFDPFEVLYRPARRTLDLQ
jgi:hypothetical protein